MSVRVSEIPNLQGQAINAPMVSAQAAGAPARALGNLAQSIAGVSDAFAEKAHQIQDAENARVESEIRRSWSVAQADLELKLQTATPQERIQKTDEMLLGLKSSYQGSDIAPIVRDRLSLNYDEWATKTRLSTVASAAMLEAKQSGEAFEAEWMEAERLNDRSRAAQALETRRQYGLVSEGEEQQLWQRFDRKEALNSLTNLIVESPLDAKELLETEGFLEKQPGISEADRITLLKQADAEISGLQRDSLKKVADRMDRGEIVTEAELEDEMKDNPFLSEAYQDELRFALTQKTPVDQDTRFALVDSLNDLHDAFQANEMSTEDYRQAHDELSRTVYALGSRDGAGALRQRVHALDPANWDTNSDRRKLKTADETKARLRSVESLGKLYAGQDAFGNVDEDAEPAERAAQAVTAQQMRLRIESDMGKWVQQNPEATEEEISTQYRKTYMNQLSGPLLESGSSTPTEKRRKMLEELDIEEVEASMDTGPKGASDKISSTPIGKNIKDMVKHFEAGGEKAGFHAKAYDDGKQYSIGYGTKARPGEVIDKAEAERRLDAELASHRQRVLGEAKKVGMEFEPHELDALTSFDFNTGRISQLLANGTRSKAEIASKMLLYRKADGKRLLGLERRRIAEATLFRRGYSNPEPTE